MTHGAPPARLRGGLLAILAIATVVAGLVSPAPAAEAATRVSTRTLLAQLTVEAEHASGYRRSRFPLWVDADKDGCDTREEVLRAEALAPPRVGAGCRITSGRWTSKYDGKTYTTPGSLDIDHLVPLAEAWQSGAWGWSTATRTAYANDLGYGNTLVAVSASVNRAKGDREPQQWLPARSACWYVASWVTVKWRWHLTVNPAEKSYLTTKLKGCHWPSMTKPRRPAIRTGTTPAPSGGTDPRFSTCAGARAAGYGPYYRGRDVECGPVPGPRRRRSCLRVIVS